ncbi:Fc.00g065090.m01.CDS01 [Cosmosporella sp. VM-42]
MVKINFVDHARLIGFATMGCAFFVLLVIATCKTWQHPCCFEKGCGNITLHMDQNLQAQCKTKTDTQWSVLDLDAFVGLDDKGNLGYLSDGGFRRHCSPCQLNVDEGRKVLLSCACANGDGEEWSPRELDLSQKVENRDGPMAYEKIIGVVCDPVVGTFVPGSVQHGSQTKDWIPHLEKRRRRDDWRSD